MAQIFPVILSGGAGTRLWPLSREMYPKQFIRFFGKDRPSMLAQTATRMDGDRFAPPIVLSSGDHRFLVQEALESVNVEAGAILLEPCARNTAPAITLAALRVAQSDPDGVLAVMPSDHLIEDSETFAEIVVRGARLARDGRIVLLGRTPTDPHTGYGYIKAGARCDGDDRAHAVAAFTEKPDRETAEKYVAAGNYLWNCGIFIMSAQTYLAEITKHEPEILEHARAALDHAEEDGPFQRVARAPFSKAKSISVDYAVMERTERAVVLPIDTKWSDVGAWASLWDETPKDARGNAVSGDGLLVDTQDTLVRSERGLVATLGVKDLVIVNTPDALLVADQSRSQDVGKIVSRLKEQGRTEHQTHIRSYRPWGHFETLALEPRFQVKKLFVKPGAKLSMQMHHHRSEHWVVVKGTARVTVGDMDKLLTENESVYIFATQWHRLENPGKVPLEVVEVQIGSYLGEDDIIRSEDIYNRDPDETR
ncbi:MAG: mannose-1-phosphate guanylyltransferase/mannose-6-phosphate isomerase [Pseudomonadota bacterium]